MHLCLVESSLEHSSAGPILRSKDDLIDFANSPNVRRTYELVFCAQMLPVSQHQRFGCRWLAMSTLDVKRHETRQALALHEPWAPWISTPVRKHENQMTQKSCGSICPCFWSIEPENLVWKHGQTRLAMCVKNRRVYVMRQPA